MGLVEGEKTTEIRLTAVAEAPVASLVEIRIHVIGFIAARQHGEEGCMVLRSGVIGAAAGCWE